MSQPIRTYDHRHVTPRGVTEVHDGPAQERVRRVDDENIARLKSVNQVRSILAGDHSAVLFKACTGVSASCQSVPKIVERCEQHSVSLLVESSRGCSSRYVLYPRWPQNRRA